MGEFNVSKTTGELEQTAGMPSEYPATQVMMSDGVTSVEEAVNGLNDTSSYSGTGYRVDKVGKTCILTIDGATGTFNVPAAYKPNKTYRDVVASANGELLGRSVITVTGDVSFNPASSSAKYGSIVYFV